MTKKLVPPFAPAGPGKRVELEAKPSPYQIAADDSTRCSVDDLTALADSGKRFSVLLVDPPWSFETYSVRGKGRSADRHYRTMAFEAIKALPVATLAAEDSVLLLWSTWPLLPKAIDLINAWSFKYKTAGFVFAKQNPSGLGLHVGMGYWTRGNTEYCLLATRGKPKRRASDVRQLILAPRGKHSEKPAEIHQRIERLLAGPYLELFPRKTVDGWTCWGDAIKRDRFHNVRPTAHGAQMLLSDLGFFDPITTED